MKPTTRTIALVVLPLMSAALITAGLGFRHLPVSDDLFFAALLVHAFTLLAAIIPQRRTPRHLFD